MSEYRRSIIKIKKSNDGGVAEAKDMSNWVDNKAWTYASGKSVVADWAGRCCYPKYIKLDPTKKYKIYFNNDKNSVGFSRFLNADKTIIKTVQGTSVVDVGTSYIVVFSTSSLSNTKTAWGTNYVINILEI